MVNHDDDNDNDDNGNNKDSDGDSVKTERVISSKPRTHGDRRNFVTANLVQAPRGSSGTARVVTARPSVIIWPCSINNCMSTTLDLATLSALPIPNILLYLHLY